MSQTLQTAAGQLIRNSAKQLPIHWLQNLSGEAMVLPVYHAAGDRRPGHLAHLRCWRDVGSFQRDLDILLRRFVPVALDDVVEHIAGGHELPKNAVHLTVDDGLREAGEVIAPLCWQKGVPATFFLTTAWLDNRALGYRHLASLLVERIRTMPAARQASLQNEFETFFRENGVDPSRFPRSLMAIDYPRRELLEPLAAKIEFDSGDYLRTARPYLDRTEVAKLIEQGFTVGAHSVDHPYFKLISPEEQYRQVAESTARVSEWFGPRHRVFAFPFDSAGVDSALIQQLHRDGIVDALFDVDWRIPGSQWPLVASRISMDTDAKVPAGRILGEAYAKNIVSKLRRRKLPIAAGGAARGTGTFCSQGITR